MRATQYIGLTKRAKEWLKSINAQEVKDSKNMTLGMFEHVPLGEWTVPEDPRMSIKEILQECPWSSGPMIFTCLEVKYSHCLPDGLPTQYFRWSLDPLVGSAEVDEEKGAYWV